MSCYLTLDEFKGLTVAPSELIDSIELVTPGWTLSQLTYWSNWIDARLRKRYAPPFSDPVPNAVQGWLARLTTVWCYVRRGVDPTDAQFAWISETAKDAELEIKEAAESVEGLFDLPLRQDTTATGITAPATRVYSEASPYVFTDQQGVRGHDEDRNGGGSYG
jgi:hypothetical protein